MCVKPLTIPNPKKDFNPVYDKQYITVPCGHCWQCVQAKQRDLETRAVAEFRKIKKLSGRVYCYTLTYDEAHVPEYCGLKVLCSRDMQLFKKRLKKRFGELGRGLDIFYAGEYGSKKDRPHWHIIIFCRFPVGPYEMADKVISAWQQGNVGFCRPWINGKKLPPNHPEGSLIDTIDAIRYTMKYCCKSYNFQAYIYKNLREWLMVNKGFVPGSDDSEQIDYVYDDKHVEHAVPKFEFPDDPRFDFSDKEFRTLKYLTHKFGSVFHCPVNFGVSQIDKEFGGLDDNYNMNIFLTSHSTDTDKYHISKYLRNKLFNEYYDKDGNKLPYYQEGCVSRKTQAWYDYHVKMDDVFRDTQIDKIVSNKGIKLEYSPWSYVSEALDYAMSQAPVFGKGKSYNEFLRNFYDYRNVYYGLPFMRGKSRRCVMKSLLSRSVKELPVLNVSSFMDRQCSVVESVINQVLSELTYITYKKDVDKYNDRQRLLVFECNSQPKYHDVLPFDKFQNLKKMSIQDVKANY